MQPWPLILVAVIVVMVVSYLLRGREERRIGAADEKKRKNMLPVITVKQIVRPDGKERVRIFQRPEGTYGVAIDHAPSDESGWLPPTSLGTGAVYASVEIAEREMALLLPWCPTCRPGPKIL